MMALGLIETRGMLPAIEGADAMLKAADVRLLEKNLATGGLVTITVAGEVAAVQASIEAATRAIGRIEGATLVSSHVIPRPDDELASILALLPNAGESMPPHARISPLTAEVLAVSGQLPVENRGGEKAPVAEASASTAGAETSPAGIAAEAPMGSRKPEPQKVVPQSASRLKAMTMSRLRQLALGLEGLPLDAEAVAKSDKKSLIAAILSVYRQIEE